MRDAVEAAMVDHGERMTVGANHPIVLAGDDAVYVRNGALDIFVQPVSAAGPGKRRLVGTAGAGALLWNGASLQETPSWRLLAVGRPGTELVRLAGATLLSLVDEPAVAERVAVAVDAIRPNADGRQRPSVAVPARLSDAQAAFASVVGAAVEAAVDDDIADAERLSSEPQRARRGLDRALTDLVDVVDRRGDAGAVPDDVIGQLDLALGAHLPRARRRAAGTARHRQWRRPRRHPPGHRPVPEPCGHTGPGLVVAGRRSHARVQRRRQTSGRPHPSAVRSCGL